MKNKLSFNSTQQCIIIMRYKFSLEFIIEIYETMSVQTDRFTSLIRFGKSQNVIKGGENWTRTVDFSTGPPGNRIQIISFKLHEF